MVKKLLWVKFGWSEEYCGGPVDGNFEYLSDNSGGEAWNFQRHSDGTYYCNTVPHGQGGAVPSSSEPEGWTVVCLSKHPKRKGIHIVGWLENAVLHGEYLQRPSDASTGAKADYTISSKTAYFVPPEARTDPFMHPSVRSAKFSYLAGPGIEPSDNAKEVRQILEEKLAVLRGQLRANVDPVDDPINSDDPQRSFGTPEQRKKVEVAAVTAVCAGLEAEGYTCKSREKDNVGYDIQAIKDGEPDCHVEVKGTSGPTERFFISRREFYYRKHPSWWLAMVTDALGEPQIEWYDLKEFEKRFDLEPLSYEGLPK